MKFSHASDSHYVNNQEKVSLLPLKRLQNPIFHYFVAMSWSSSSFTAESLNTSGSADFLCTILKLSIYWPLVMLFH